MKIMNFSSIFSHTASSVSQDKKGCVQDLGRGSCSKNTLQSPKEGSPSSEVVTVSSTVLLSTEEICPPVDDSCVACPGRRPADTTGVWRKVLSKSSEEICPPEGTSCVACPGERPADTTGVRQKVLSKFTEEIDPPEGASCVACPGEQPIDTIGARENVLIKSKGRRSGGRADGLGSDKAQVSGSVSKVVDSINVAQINLHHSKNASALLCKRLCDGSVDIALVQEPWTLNGRVLGLGVKGFNIYYDITANRPRACIVANSKLHAIILANYIDGDNVAVKIIQNGKSLILLSAYLPFDNSDPLANCTKSLLDFCNASVKLVIGCDANAHHTIWGSSDCNHRGDELLEYILYYNLYILNRGNKPTFVTINRSEVLDITLCNSQCFDSIDNWHVSDDITLSDHRLILFTINGLALMNKTEGRNPRRTNWVSYRNALKFHLSTMNGNLSSHIDVDNAVSSVCGAISSSYTSSCPVSTVRARRHVPWWTAELAVLRRNCRRLFNKAKKSGDWQAYKSALTKYNKTIRDSKRSSWRNYCSSINDLSASAKLVKLMAKDRSTNLNCVKMINGRFSESGRDTLTEMFRIHFPNCLILPGLDALVVSTAFNSSRDSWDIARKIITYDRVVWAIKSFGPYKTPGLDGIIPILLREGIDLLAPILCKIFRACIAMGFVPTLWRQTRVVFIPKVGKDNYFEAKSFRPICLSSFLLKTVEKLIDRYVRETTLALLPLSVNQHAYQSGKSTVTALYDLSYTLEKSMCSKEFALAAFLDIEGAFDKVPVDTIMSALVNKGIDMTICHWIENLLTSRFITASLFGDTLSAHLSAGCPQGGVLSPLLWCIVVDSLLAKLSSIGVHCIGYADDIAIVARGKFGTVITGFMSSALRAVENWCNDTGLSVNPSKTCLVAFPSARNLKMHTVSFFGQPLACSTEVKFLGVYFDSRLGWKYHLNYCLTKARRAFWACRNAIGRTWGLSPRSIYWIYTMIIRPIISYGSIVWWSRSGLVSARNDLVRIQRMACLAITGCLRTTPTATLELLLNLLPLHMHIEAEALVSRKRLIDLGYWKGYSQYLSWGEFNYKVLDHPFSIMPTDGMLVKHVFDRPFSFQFPSRDDWKRPPNYSRVDSVVWYTDGSKIGSHTGAGVCCPDRNIEYSYSLGRHATVFQAEVYAILMCSILCLKSNYFSKHILICSDSQAALLALQSSAITSSLVWDCYNSLCRLSCVNKVILYWIPGHSGISGNELADSLARTGSGTPFIGPEPVLGIASNCYRGTVTEIFRQLQYSNWLKSKGQRQAKELNQGFPGIRCKELLCLTRPSLSRAIGLLTGHCRLKRHLNIMRVVNDPICRGCHQEEETAAHILCDCEYFSAYRFEFLGRHIIEPWELHNMTIKSMLMFASATGLFS